MAAKDLGTKHTCFKCGTKFYDLKKTDPICPKCGADQRESPVLKAPPERRQRAPARPVAPVAVAAEDAEVEVESDEEVDAEADEDEDEDEADEA
jgi:uncharacterized protein (TIGR02300 family)